MTPTPPAWRRPAPHPRPKGSTHLYMKHMPHHMLPAFPLDWAEGCVHAHLIRHPARVLASYAAKHEAVNYEEIGFAQQEAFFERFPGPVIDSADIRRDPAGMLQRSLRRDRVALYRPHAVLARRSQTL
jgi:hypothetical protein